MFIQKVRLADKKIKQIYEDSFTKNERMPFVLMVAMSKLWNTEFLSFYENDIPCGFIYFAKNSRIVFIMFFAVSEDMRSKGYGTLILNEIKKMYPSEKIIVSIEPCLEQSSDEELCIRRKNFYLRNGFRESGYNMRLNKTDQEILVANGDFNKRQFISFFAHYSNGTVWPKIWKT